MAGAKSPQLMAKGSLNHGPFFQDGAGGWHHRIGVVVVVEKLAVLDKRRLIKEILEIWNVLETAEDREHIGEVLEDCLLGEVRGIGPGNFG